MQRGWVGCQSRLKGGSFLKRKGKTSIASIGIFFVCYKLERFFREAIGGTEVLFFFFGTFFPTVFFFFSLINISSRVEEVVRGGEMLYMIFIAEKYDDSAKPLAW